MTGRGATAGQRGFAIITVLMLIALVAVLLGAHFLVTRVELSTTKSSMDSTRGFYAAEAGLNLRAEEIRKKFLGYNRPVGTAPVPIPGQLPCQGADQGSGDFACVSYTFKGRDVRTYVEESWSDDEGPDEPETVVIPPGEDFQGLTAQEYTYEVSSMALGTKDRPEAILEMHFKSRLVPLFQFVAFYDKDLEILPGPPMTLNGPVHTNANLFLQSDGGSTLTIDGQVTTGGQLFHGRKNENTCWSGTVSVHNLGGPQALPDCPGSSRQKLLAGDVDGTNPPHLDWDGMLRVGATVVEVPLPEALDPAPGQMYWDRADLRIMLALDEGRQVQVRNADGSTNDFWTQEVADDCDTALWQTEDSFYNQREGTYIDMLEVDVRELMDCIALRPGLMDNKGLDEGSEGGLVWYFGVDDGVNAAAPNSYGVRVQGGSVLGPTSGTVIRGLTIVTNQAVYIQGDYNEDGGAGWRPAAFLADSLNVLSNGWDDEFSDDPLWQRKAEDTTVRAAFLAGTDTTGGPGGEGLLDPGSYNGGLENYPRFHEDWKVPLRTLTYRGSFVSLNQPIRVDGTHSAQSYRPPARDWAFDTHFHDASNLPPMTPRFVYLKHELFVREYEY